MGRETTFTLFSIVILILLLVPFVHGQELNETQMDSDADGVFEKSDICPATNLQEGLPVISVNKEYLGCSCSQIYNMLKETYCYDIFCVSGREFSIKERSYSSRKTNCDVDYCVNSTLYDYPEVNYISCVNGKEQEINCTPTITHNAPRCINGSVLQYVAQSETIENKSPDLAFLDDYEKLQKRAYSLAVEDPLIKSGLGISGEELFIQTSKETRDEVDIKKSVKTETKKIGNSERLIYTVTIELIPKNYRKLEKVYVFEELPRESKLVSSDVIPEPAVLLEVDGPLLLIWELDKIVEPVTVSYQVNKEFVGESNTLIVARDVKNHAWFLMLIPLVLLIIVVGIFFYVSEKSVPKRKKIFKEK